MKNSKMFFKDKCDVCYEKRDILAEMKESGIDKQKVWSAKCCFGDTFHWCKVYSDFVENGEDQCGKCCKSYSPRNKKNGCCSNLGYCYDPVSPFILYANGKLELIKR